MPDLVTLAELKTHLGVTSSSDDALLTELLENVEALFESETGRTRTPFVAAQSGRTEVIDGTGGTVLYLDYAIATLTSVKLGFDSALPDETLSVSDKKVLVYGVGNRRLARVDGCTFGIVGAPQPRYVQVVYDAQSDLPEDAQLAIKSVAAAAYRRRGSEDAKTESLDNFTHELLQDLAASDPFWPVATRALQRVLLA